MVQNPPRYAAIDWHGMGNEGLERCVESLVLRSTPRDHRYVAPEGKGGGGRDIKMTGLHGTAERKAKLSRPATAMVALHEKSGFTLPRKNVDR